MVKIGHARISERGTVEGTAGDQTTHEVEVSNWYSGGWQSVFRPNDPDRAEIIARSCAAACANNNIGYSQPDRDSLYNALRKVTPEEIAELKEKVNCDCSSLVAVCVISAGILITPHMTTRSEDSALMGSGEFTRLVAAEYTDADKKLKRGDILKKQGHTAIVLTNGDECDQGTGVYNKTNIYADALDKSAAGIYITTDECYIREGASVTYRAMGVLPKDTKLYNYGFYSVDNRGVIWRYVETKPHNIKFTGFVSSNVCRKIVL